MSVLIQKTAARGAGVIWAEMETPWRDTAPNQEEPVQPETPQREPFQPEGTEEVSTHEVASQSEPSQNNSFQSWPLEHEHIPHQTNHSHTGSPSELQQDFPYTDHGEEWRRMAPRRRHQRTSDPLQAFGQGLTDWDRHPVRERLSIELVRWRDGVQTKSAKQRDTATSGVIRARHDRHTSGADGRGSRRGTGGTCDASTWADGALPPLLATWAENGKCGMRCA